MSFHPDMLAGRQLMLFTSRCSWERETWFH
jgi:hypothetical protein